MLNKMFSKCKYYFSLYIFRYIDISAVMSSRSIIAWISSHRSEYVSLQLLRLITPENWRGLDALHRIRPG